MKYIYIYIYIYISYIYIYIYKGNLQSSKSGVVNNFVRTNKLFKYSNLEYLNIPGKFAEQIILFQEINNIRSH